MLGIVVGIGRSKPTQIGREFGHERVGSPRAGKVAEGDGEHRGIAHQLERRDAHGRAVSSVRGSHGGGQVPLLSPADAVALGR